ncbi:RNA-binding (RRM/RBD/RNP motifs) family protein isoform X2 [Wolffia australiana]
MRFVRSGGDGGGEESANLYVANCGPAVGVALAEVAAAFGVFGEVAAVHPADGSGSRVVVCFADASSSRAAMAAWGGTAPCPALGGRALHLRYSVSRPPSPPPPDALSVALDAEELALPGLLLAKDFITPDEETELLAEVDARPWRRLAKRRVQHYGHVFMYETRNVDPSLPLGDLPAFLSNLLLRIASFAQLSAEEDDEAGTARVFDQVTVNEYPPGVGISPHIDTHSAFTGPILSLSLAGPCVMEFRQHSPPARKAIFLPPRSLLVMSGDARYAWHHYIPHHKVDFVRGEAVRRGARRVSVTFRKVRSGPCRCRHHQLCDSQSGGSAGR